LRGARKLRIPVRNLHFHRRSHRTLPIADLEAACTSLSKFKSPGNSFRHSTHPSKGTEQEPLW
jgi:hypothetical protein